MSHSAPTVLPDRLAALKQLNLDRGGHSDFEDGHCAMEVVSWLAGEGFTDAPACASPVLTRMTIRLNDRWDDSQRQRLVPLLPRMVGTGGDGKDAAREHLALTVLVHDLIPDWYEAAGRADLAQSLRDLPAIVDQASREDALRALRRSRDELWAARSSWRAQLREKVRQAVLARGGSDAAADAAADADAAAAAAADADAAAAAAAGLDRWGHVYWAVRDALREHYEKVITERFAGIAEQHNQRVLQLLEDLIDPASGSAPQEVPC